MAALVPVAFQALTALQTIGTVAQVVDRGSNAFSNKSEKSSALALTQLQQQQQLNARAAADRTALDKQEIKAKAAEAEIQRRNALKRAVAKQRAKFGGSGVSSGDGSSEAVLLGLFEETEKEKAASDRLDNLKLQALDQSLANTNRTNTLKRTQLAERERLKNSSSSLETITDLFSIF